MNAVMEPSRQPKFRGKGPPTPHATRVLVADDEHLVATDIALSLTELGYVVVGPVGDGEAAAQLARVALPDLALLDIRMPKSDGIAVAQIILSELAIPSVILSAYSDPHQVEQASHAGVFGYIVKPAEPDQLRVSINVALARYHEHVAAQAESSDLRRRLEQRRVVEHAKWILVRSQSMEEPDAMKALQKAARDRRKPLVDIATAVVQTGSLPS